MLTPGKRYIANEMTLTQREECREWCRRQGLDPNLVSEILILVPGVRATVVQYKLRDGKRYMEQDRVTVATEKKSINIKGGV